MTDNKVIWKFGISKGLLKDVYVRFLHKDDFKRLEEDFSKPSGAMASRRVSIDSDVGEEWLETKSRRTLVRQDSSRVEARVFGSFGLRGRHIRKRRMTEDADMKQRPKVPEMFTRSIMDLIVSLVPIRVVSQYLEALQDLDYPEDNTPFTIKLKNPDAFDGAVLFADVSAFAVMAQRYREKYDSISYAPDALASTMNRVLYKMVQTICDYRGDVINFAGDGILATFDAADFDDDIQKAVEACADVAAALVAAVEVDDTGETVRFHCGIGCGKVVPYHLGGEGHHVEYFLTGDTVQQINQTEPQAGAGQVVVSKDAAAMLSHRLIPETKLNKLKYNCRILESDSNSLGETERHNKQEDLFLEIFQSPPFVQNLLRQLLDFYAPIPVHKVKRGGNSIWTAELRLSCTMFLRLEGINYESQPRTIQVMHRALAIIQLAVNHNDGELLRFSVDEKGATVLVAFGLPPRRPGSDGVRAIKSALTIQREIQTIEYVSNGKLRQLKCSIGIAGGKVFCGTVGGNARREYTVHGTCVNFANNLMVEASNHILVDQNTYESAKDQIVFMPNVRKVRNKATPDVKAQVFEPVSVRIEHDIEFSAKDAFQVGRQAETFNFETQIHRLYQYEHVCNLFVVQGDIGMGKTEFCKEAMGISDRLSNKTAKSLLGLYVKGDDTERRNPYFVWRMLALQALRRSAIAKTKKAGVFQAEDLEPTLKALRAKYKKRKDIDIAITDSELQETMEYLFMDYRHDKNTDAVDDFTPAVELHILEIFKLCMDTDGKLSFIVDDLHLVDKYSRKQLQTLTALSGVNLLVTYFAKSEDSPSYVSALIDKWNALSATKPESQVYVTTLKGLTTEEISKCMTRWQGVSRLSRRAVRYVEEVSAGVPLFAKALTQQYRLFNHGELTPEGEGITEDGIMDFDVIESTAGFTYARDISTSVTWLVDQLTETQRLILKTASVMGVQFNSLLLRHIITEFDVLSDIATREGDKTQTLSGAEGIAEVVDKMLQWNLDELVREKMLYQVGDGFYEFESKIVRNVCYVLFVAEVKQRLHLSIATLHDERVISLAEGFTGFERLLFEADQWYRAGRLDKALPLLIDSVQTAEDTDQRKCRYTCYTRLLKYSEEHKLPDTIDAIQVAQWKRNLGALYVMFGRPSLAKQYLAQAEADLSGMHAETNEQQMRIDKELQEIKSLSSSSRKTKNVKTQI